MLVPQELLHRLFDRSQACQVEFEELGIFPSELFQLLQSCLPSGHVTTRNPHFGVLGEQDLGQRRA